MFFADKLTLDRPRRSSEGYMGIHARGARSGVYQYLGAEVDPEGAHFQADQIVNVYRAPEEVFNAQALGSFVAKPITDDHPSRPVTSSNWRDLARGTTMGAVKEGEYVGFDLAFLDADLIETIDSGKRELSCGYASEIIIGDGVAPDGTAFQARQVGIRGNHIAVVEKGRAGSTCRIGDAATCEPMPSDEVRKILTDGQPYNPASPGDKNEHARRETSNSGGSQVATKTITFDGLPLEVTDAAEAAITKLQNQLKDASAKVEKAEGDLSTALKDKSTLEGEKAALETQLKDAEVSPEKLERLAADRATLVAVAKAVDPNVVTDGKTEAEIRKGVVEAKLGDAAKSLDDAGIAGAFAALSRDAKVEKTDQLRDALRSTPIVTADASAVRDMARASQY